MSLLRVCALFRYPVKSLAGAACSQAAVEPWGLAGDRRWMLTTPEGVQLTQREHPRLALVSAEPRPHGGIRVAAPGRRPLDVVAPTAGGAAVATTVVRVFGSEAEAVPGGPEARDWFAEHLGADVELVYMRAPERSRPLPAEYGAGRTVSFADAFPLLLTSVSSLHALNSLIAQGDHPGEGPLPMDRFRPSVVVEGAAPWAEDGWRRVRIGDVVCTVAKSCGRCVVTTVDQATARSGREPLRTLARHRRSGDQLNFGRYLIPEHTGRVRSGDSVEVLEPAA